MEKDQGVHDHGAEEQPLNSTLWRSLRRVWRVLPVRMRTAARNRVAAEILGDDWPGDTDRVIEKELQKVTKHSMVPPKRLATLYRQVLYLDRYAIGGDLVECGVWKGGAVGTMAIAHMSSAKPPFRYLQLFDSWQGLPEPRVDTDGAVAVKLTSRNASGKLRPIGECVADIGDCQRLLEDQIRYPRALIKYHRGWFQDTLPKVAPAMGPIALLRLDGDWYDSTKICLEYLYPRVVSNGVIHIDDYGHWVGCRRAVDEFLDAQPGPLMLHSIDSSGRYWLKP
jgi:O-methyltransferase